MLEPTGGWVFDPDWSVSVSVEHLHTGQTVRYGSPDPSHGLGDAFWLIFYTPLLYSGSLLWWHVACPITAVFLGTVQYSTVLSIVRL